MWNRTRKFLKTIREIIWPLLEPLENSAPEEINEADSKWNDDEVDLILNYIEKYQESEEERRRTVESKSIIFIGTFGIATVLLTNLVHQLILTDGVTFSFFKLFILGLITLAIVYLCRAVWFSVRVLERKGYHAIKFPKFILSDSIDKKRRIAIEKYNNIKKDQDIINLKVDYMTMTQEYFKRAIIVIGLFSIIILLFNAILFIGS